LPISVLFVVCCWIVPLFLHERAKGIFQWLGSRGWIGIGSAVILVILALVGTVIGSRKIFRFHSDHLALVLKRKEAKPEPSGQKREESKTEPAMIDTPSASKKNFPKPPRKVRLHSEELPAGKTNGPHFPSGFHEVTDQITITLGSLSATVFVSAIKKFGKSTPFSIYGTEPVTLSLTKDDQLVFSFTSWAGVPVTVKDSEVTIGDPLVDRNFGENAFEIVDRTGEPIFQMVRQTPNIILINGIFPTPNISQTTGQPIILWISPQTGVMSSSIRPPQFNLKPIFKYPSWKHPGEYAEQ
jgi:hypothetical protein